MITTGAISISQALMVNQTLLELRIWSNNQIGDDGIAAIAGSLSYSSITFLDVRDCGISVVGDHEIMSAMNSAMCKTVVTDSDCWYGDKVKRMKNFLNSEIQNVRIKLIMI